MGEEFIRAFLNKIENLAGTILNDDLMINYERSKDTIPYDPTIEDMIIFYAKLKTLAQEQLRDLVQ
jgi:hypothetical protein